VQKLNSYLVIVIVSAFIFISASFSVGSFANQPANNPITSKMALEEALNKHKGDVIYLDFWASWCGPCRKSFPWMNTIQEKFQAQGFTVISVNLDAEKPLALKFLQENPASFAVVYDPKGKLARKFKVKGMPSSMLIGRDGQIKVQHTGFFTKKIPSYEQEIMQLLKESRG